MTEPNATPPASWTARAALAVLVGVGLALRVRDAGRGITSEEGSDLRHGSAWTLWTDQEVGVNPPLLKWLVNLPFECWNSLWFGRVLSVLCGTLAIALLFHVARRAARGSDTAGLLAATVIALSSDAIRNSAEFRPYGVWQLVGALHLVALFHLVDVPTSVGARRVVVATAILLPQLHYFGIPWIGALALVLALSADTRWMVKLYAWSCALVTPLLLLGLAMPHLRKPDGSAALRTLLTVTSLDLPAPAAFAAPVIDGLGLSRTDFITVEHSLFSLALAALLVPYVTGFSRTSVHQRLLLGSALSVPLAIVTIGQVHLVRSPVVMMLLTSLPAAIAAAPFVLPEGSARFAARLAGLTVFATGLIAFWTRPPEVDRSRWPSDFLATWHQLDAARGGRDILLYPKGTVGLLYLVATHHAWDQMDGRNLCPDGGDTCFFLEGARFVEIGGWPSTPPDGIVAAFGPTPKGFGDGCVVLRAQGPTVWDCRPVPP